MSLGGIIIPLEDPVAGNIISFEGSREIDMSRDDIYIDPLDLAGLVNSNNQMELTEGLDAASGSQVQRLDSSSEKDPSEPAVVILEEIVDVNANNKPKRKRQFVPGLKTPTKKRKLDPPRWKCSQAKSAYNTGKAHTSLRGKDIPARTMKGGCGASCRRNCQGRIRPEQRQALFNKYWSFGDKMTQWFFLAKLVKVVDIKKRTTNVEDGSQPYRKQAYEYYLNELESGTQIRVCQAMFLATFDISISVIKTSLLKNSPDKRGKHGNRIKTSPVLIQSVKEHIKRFPVVDSHYCRADSVKKYLDPHLSIAQMYRMYLVGRDKTSSDTASLRQYRDIFNTCFNLSFFKPKKDQCSVCCEFQSMTEEQKLSQPTKVIAYNAHRNAIEKARSLKTEDKALSRDTEAMATLGKNVRMVTFDLQKVLYCPRVEIGDYYYKRKLSCFNFTVFDCTKKQAFLYVWDNSVAMKGSNEISSFVLNYMQTMIEEGVNDFRFYSDSCPGQNKNQFLYTMYYMAARKFNISITHRYLEKGHTQMECDNVHARIEKKTKGQEIFVPAQWYGFMRTAKVKKPQYIVNEVKQKEVFTFKDLAVNFLWSKIPITKVREIKFDSSNPEIVVYRTDWDKAGKELKVMSTKVGRPINWATYRPSQAYSGRLPLKAKLVADIKWFIKKDLIPQQWLPYFLQIIQPAPAPTTVDAYDSEDNDVPQEIVHADGVLEEILEAAENNEESDEHQDLEPGPPENDTNGEDELASSDSDD